LHFLKKSAGLLPYFRGEFNPRAEPRRQASSGHERCCKATVTVDGQALGSKATLADDC
jgi:hypothetical protein